MISLKRALLESLETRRLLSATVSGVVYQDIGAVGSLQPADPPLAGWTIFLDLHHDSTLDVGDPSTVSDAAGRYTFSGIAAGTYDVREEPVTGFKPIPDAFQTITLTDGQTFANLNFGNQKLIDFTYPGLSAAQDDVNQNPTTTDTTTANAPNSSIAINGKYIVTISGNSISTYRRSDGTRLTTESLATFFGLAGDTIPKPLPLPNAADATDAKVVYDAGVGKFFVSAIANTSTGSELLIAGSPRLAPNMGMWHYHAIDVQAPTVQFLNSENVFASDLSLSFNGTAIFLTTNVNDSAGTFVGSRLWIIPRGKAFALTSTPLVDYKYDPSTAAGVALPAELSDIDAAIFSSKSILNVATEYLVAADNSSSGDLLDVIKVTSPGKKAKFALTRIATPSVTPNTLTPTPPTISTTAPPPAAQADGAPSIDTSANAISAVWRKEDFWIADTLTPSTGPDAGNATVYWFQLNLPTDFTAGLALVDYGSVSGSAISPGASTFAPSISVDRDQYMALSFAAAGPVLDPGSYVTSRRTPDPLYTIRPAYAINTGQSTYSATLNSTTNLAEWGPNAITLDPLTQERFWVLGQAATDPTSSTGPWSQQLVGFEIPPKVFPVVNG